MTGETGPQTQTAHGWSLLLLNSVCSLSDSDGHYYSFTVDFLTRSKPLSCNASKHAWLCCSLQTGGDSPGSAGQSAGGGVQCGEAGAGSDSLVQVRLSHTGSLVQSVLLSSTDLRGGTVSQSVSQLHYTHSHNLGLHTGHIHNLGGLHGFYIKQ